MYRPHEEGRVLSKHVGINKNCCIVVYVRCAYVNFINEQFVTMHGMSNVKISGNNSDQI